MYFAHWPSILGASMSGSLPVRPWQSSQFSETACRPLESVSEEAGWGEGTQGFFAKWTASASISSSEKPLRMRFIVIALRWSYFHCFITRRR